MCLWWKMLLHFFPERRLHNGCSFSPVRWNSNSFYVHRVTFGTVITTKFLVTSNQSIILFLILVLHGIPAVWQRWCSICLISRWYSIYSRHIRGRRCISIILNRWMYIICCNLSCFFHRDFSSWDFTQEI